MNTILTLVLQINAQATLFADTREIIEASLPCISCERTRRTVILSTDGKSICTPRDKCAGFPGKLEEIRIQLLENAFKIIYRIAFNYKPFIDKKYGIESDLNQHQWARIYFTLKCPRCGSATEFFSQGNLGRPRNFTCPCGTIIAQEESNPFTFTYSEISGN